MRFLRLKIVHQSKTLLSNESSRQDEEEWIQSIEKGSSHIDIDESRLPFELVRNLRQGAMGPVEEVRDRFTGQTFARKSIQFSRPQQNTIRDMLQKEVYAIQNSGQHYHFINVFAIYATKDSIAFLLQPVAEHGNLEDYLHQYQQEGKERKTVSLRQAAMIGVLAQGLGCLANGLAFLHSRTIRHTNINPHNILVHKDQLVYTHFHNVPSYLNNSTAANRPASAEQRYYAPEVVQWALRSPRSDVYSLGCVFLDIWFAVSALRGFDDTMYSVVMGQIHDALVRNENLGRAQIPSQWSFLPNIFMTMTMENATDRPSAHFLSRQFLEHKGFFCDTCGGN
jgi:serine/threonine protein kinase